MTDTSIGIEAKFEMTGVLLSHLDAISRHFNKGKSRVYSIRSISANEYRVGVHPRYFSKVEDYTSEIWEVRVWVNKGRHKVDAATLLISSPLASE